MDFNIDQFSPMRDTGTDKASEQPAFVSHMHNCYVNSGNIVPIKLPKGDLPEGWRVIKEIHTADAVVCDVVIDSKYTETVVYNKKTRRWEPAAPAIGSLAYKGDGTYSDITGEILLSNLLSSLKKTGWTTTTYSAVPNKCMISDDGAYIFYLVSGACPVMSRDGGVSFSSITYSSSALSGATDFVATTDLKKIWVAVGSTIWYSINYGVDWVSKSFGSYIVKLAWYDSANIYMQYTDTSGALLNISTNIVSSPTVQGKAVDGYGKTVSDHGLLFTNGTLFSGVTQGFSDEPDGSAKWAYLKLGKWYDETGEEIKPKIGKIIYVCRSFDVSVELTGDSYVIFKEDRRVISLPASNSGHYNADGSSIEEWVENQSDIIGVSGGTYLVYRNKSRKATTDTVYGYTNFVQIDLMYGKYPSDGPAAGSFITELKKVNLLTGEISLLENSIVIWTLKSEMIFPYYAKVLTRPDSSYVALAFRLTQLWNYQGKVGFAYLKVTEDRKILSFEVPVSLNIFSGSDSIADYTASISLSGDNIIGAGNSAYNALYAGKAISIPISTLLTLENGSSSANGGTVTMLGDYPPPVSTQIGPIVYYGGSIFLSPPNKTIQPTFTFKASTMGAMSPFKMKVDSQVVTANDYGFGADRARCFSHFVSLGTNYYPISTSFSRIFKDNSLLVMSTPSGLLAISLADFRTRLLSTESNIQFSVSAETGDVLVGYADSTGIHSIYMTSGFKTLHATCDAGAYLYIKRMVGVVLNGLINLIGCSVAPGGDIYGISPTLTSASVLSLGATVKNGTYTVHRSGLMKYLTSVISTTTTDEILIFQAPNGMIYKKLPESFSVPFFETEVFDGVDAAYTYFPDFVSMFNARLAMAGGFALTGADEIINGNMTTLTGWTSKNATTDGTKMTITTGGYIKQVLPDDCIIVVTVTDPTSILFDGVQDKSVSIIKGTGTYRIILCVPTKTFTIRARSNFKAANLVVTAVHAYKIERCDTSVYISDQANYEEFYGGTGSIQKLPALGIVFNGMIPIGDSLYLIRDGSTAKISETGSASNPFAVVEEYVRQGGQYPFKCLQTFAVVRKATSKGIDTGEVYLFSGTDYVKLNTVWNSTFDRPFSFNQILSAEVNGITVLSQADRAILIGDSGRSLNIETHQYVEKIGEFILGGIVCGDINEDVFVTQEDDYAATFLVTAGKPNARKRVRKVKVLPEQSCVVSCDLSVVETTNGAASFNATGRDINLVIDIDSESYIEGLQIDADVIMPTERR